ncbi:predicted protein [Naegleria gruberi]|uniref:Predicted protein n=1 Tax=Naegleria gruberi TaxID=5762 RepID=D2W4K6_NAEGR|nr:uncharacterized protein NAEGRDRAFT_76340 [Naegleria gruberi]EFC35996.1 predicted protein [Naegleria gruberi]|eukprot:XP_002668740.1 predicted protein [Naegleria gruberi strain NEG-M]
MQKSNFYEEPIGESVVIKLDHHIGSRSLTNFYRNDAKFQSPLISFTQYYQLFRGELKTHRSPKLIFRASRDGFSEVEFRKRCEDQGKIVIIVKSKGGDLFGGYTTETLKLDQRGSNVKDEESFTFRFDDNTLYIFRLMHDHNIHALYRYSSLYLFAFGYCFWVCGDANTSTYSSSHNATQDYILPECKLPQREINQVFDDEFPNNIVPDEKRQYFGGFNFLVEDFEVYKVVE